MYRFFVAPEVLRSAPVVLGRELAHRLGRVLRLRTGDRIVLLDDTGWQYEAEIIRLDRDVAEVRVLSHSPASGEPAIRIHLYQGLLKATKLEWVLQKGTELGIASFTPVLCSRCVAGPPTEAILARWRQIVQEAAEQSRRGRLPPIHPAVPLAEALASAPGLRLLPWEGEHSRGLRSALARDLSQRERGARCLEPEARSLKPDISLFIGPEGGWEEGEVALATAADVQPVSLGPRILRAETAGLVAAAAILYQAGELGGG